MQLKDWEKSYSGECWQHRTNPETVSSPSWTADSIRQCDRPAFEIFFYTFTHTFTRTHARMHARTHARTHTHTHAHAHTHACMCNAAISCCVSCQQLTTFCNYSAIFIGQRCCLPLSTWCPKKLQRPKVRSQTIDNDWDIFAHLSSNLSSNSALHFIQLCSKLPFKVNFSTVNSQNFNLQMFAFAIIMTMLINKNSWQMSLKQHLHCASNCV